MSKRAANTIDELNVIRFSRLDTIFRKPAVDRDAAQELLAATSLELHRVQQRTMLLATNARRRVASFLLEMSERLGQPAILDVAMSRQDVAALDARFAVVFEEA